MLPFVFKTFVLSIFEWLIKTGLTVITDGESLQARFFSQDLSKYFWYFECYQRDANTDSFQSCTGCGRLFELHIKDNRTPPTLDAELDLNGIPWGLVSQDFTDFTGLEFDDPKVKYFWTGEGIVQQERKIEPQHNHARIQKILSEGVRYYESRK